MDKARSYGNILDSICTGSSNKEEQVLKILTPIKKSLIDIIQRRKRNFMNTGNSKMSEPHRFKLSLTDNLNLKDSEENMALANLSIYYTWKDIKSSI